MPLRFPGLPSGPVLVADFNRETIEVLSLADRWSHQTGITVDVNAVDNGEHSTGTLHGFSRAWDLDTAADVPVDVTELFRYLRSMLPPGYDVVNERTHVHVEWQPKR